MTDVVVIGAGHNGLACAAYLARAGHRVVVVEAAADVGGAAVTQAFAGEFKVSACAHLLNQLDGSVAKDLSLERHGLTLAADNLPTIALDTDGAIRRIAGGEVAGDGVGESDANAYAAFHAQMGRFAKVLGKAAAMRPPTLVDGDRRDKLTMAQLAWHVRMLGRDDMRELLRVGAINLYDVLNDRLKDERLKGALSVDGVLGAHMGPRSPNTVLGYLYRRLGEGGRVGGPAIPLGGMGAVGEAFAAAARACGAQVRTGNAVARVLIENGKAAGVELADGERLDADIVVSNADPKTTFEHLVGFQELETGFCRRIDNFRMRGTAAKLHLALDGVPEFAGVAGEDVGARLVIAPDLGYVERAFDHAKYGEFSSEPIMEITLPTVHDPSLAPEGKHVLSAVVQFAPYEFKAGWESARAEFVELLIGKLAEYAPGIRDLIIGSELLTPVDIEQRFRLRGGHWHHGELCLDQFMMMRPVPGAAQYATPLDGLFLCGAGAHPGGGIMGLAGRNAAGAILRAVRSSGKEGE